MKILVTGDRLLSDRAIVRFAFDCFPGMTSVVEGECTGADTLARAEAEARGIAVHPHPAPWRELGTEAGPWRNGLMLREHPDISVALVFHQDLRKSTGTKDMVARLRKRRRIHTYHFRRDERGKIVCEELRPDSKPHFERH